MMTRVENGRLQRAAILGGLSAGVLDLTAAFVQYGLLGVSPVRIGQSIASGLLGRAAYGGGMGTAILGVVLHFVIALTAAALYVVSSRRITMLLYRPIFSGVLYGAAVHAFMQFVVLPLSRFATMPFNARAFVTGLAIHILFVGLPIALIAERSMTQSR